MARRYVGAYGSSGGAVVKTWGRNCAQDGRRAARTLAGALWLGCVPPSAGCHGQADANALPACDAFDVQEAARKAAAETVKIPFTLSSFAEVETASTGTRRACRVRAKHSASGASLWMRFTLERRPAKPGKKGTAHEELAVVFAPLL